MRLNLEGDMAGEYRVLHRLADGGTTEVYLARAPDGASVIVKALNGRLRPELGVSEERVLWHYRNEVEAHSRVRHEHIVKLVGFGEGVSKDGRRFYYLASEYMPGGHLGNYCREQRILSLEDVIRFFGPVVEAVSHAHRQRLIHCDIKPSNLLFDDRHNPTLLKLADFGVSKILEEGRAGDRMLVGTAPYAAPEHHPQADHSDLMQPVDDRADVFSLAVTIYYAMTGLIPGFDGGELDELPFHPSIEPYRFRLTSVLRRATAARVDGRYSSAEEFWADFKEYESPLPARGNDEDDEVPTIYTEYNKMVSSLGVAEESQNLEASNAIRLPGGSNLDIAHIPSGRYLMGTSREEIEQLINTYPAYIRSYARVWLNWEHPQHEAPVERFWLGKYPVTAKQWRDVATYLPPETCHLTPSPNGDLSEDLPVTLISWEEAVEFCHRLSRYTQKTCRLPSEAEWEYACRSGTPTPFNFIVQLSTEQVNYSGLWPRESDSSYGPPSRGVANVGTVGGANAFGLHDMHGNVWEWCADAWHESYAGAPQSGSVWEDLYDALRVMRGGSYLSFGSSCRSASRASSLCFERFKDVGFRVAIGC